MNLRPKRQPRKSMNRRRRSSCGTQGSAFAMHQCWCRACDEQEARKHKARIASGKGVIPWLPPGLTVLRINYCGHCGFRRCPCATNHLFTCSASDAPGQEGSHYR